jgi:hypothetical protein
MLALQMPITKDVFRSIKFVAVKQRCGDDFIGKKERLIQF